jgi:HK97 family phage major capsid protein
MEGLSPQPIGKRIEATEQMLVSLKDQLTNLGNQIAQVDSPTDEQQTEVEAITAEIQAKEKSLLTLKNVEAGLKTKAVQVASPRSSIPVFPGFERKALQPRDYFYKAITASVIAQMWKARGRIVGAEEIVKERFGDDEAMQLVLKAVTNPANTTVAGWAQELVATVLADFMAALPVMSIYPGLSAAGQRLTFGRAGIIKVPLRNTVALGSPGALNGSFVGEGQPIPVRRASLGSISLTPKKMAVISSFTKEMDLHSTPSIEAVVRQAINEDTSRAIDAALIDATAADTIRPAGLKAAANTPNSITPEAVLTTTYDKMVSDLKRMINGIVAAGGGTSLVLLINPADALSLQWVTIADGSFPFDSVQNGVLRGIRVLQSTTVTAKQPLMVDAGEFVSVTADTPEFDVSDQATIHEEDTTPLPISATGAPNTVAAPVRSLWQTYSMAVRMILPMNWAMRRVGMVSYMNANVGW